MTSRFALWPVLLCLALAACSGSSNSSLLAPSSPTNLAAPAVEATTVVLAWALPAPAGPVYLASSGFIIERSAAAAGFVEIARVGLGRFDPKAMAFFGDYTDTPLTPRTMYRYRLRTVVGAVPFGYSNTVAVTTLTPVPRLASVTPDSGYQPGGQRVTLTGQGFEGFSAGLNEVMFGGELATSVVVIDDESLTCTTPASAGATGPVDVIVTNANGTSDPLENGFTYFAFPPEFAGDVRLDVTKTVGTAPSSRPRLCRAGGVLYTVWVDERGFDEDLYFTRSLDGGATWEADIRIDRGVVGCATNPEILCNGTNVYVVWADDRTGAFDIYFNRSTDSGATWQPDDVRLNTDLPDGLGSWNPQICGADDHLYVAFSDDRNGSVRDIYVTRSTDAGVTWEPEIQVDSNSVPGWSLLPQIACEGAAVWVTWEDYRDSVLGGVADIYVTRSTDGGATWPSTDTRLDSGQGASSSPRICSAGSNVYVVWEDLRNDPNSIRADIYLARSDDSGTTWQSDVRLDTDPLGSARSVGAQMSCSGDDVYVVWEDFRDDPNAGQPTNSDVYVTRSNNGGVSFSPEERIDRAPGAAPVSAPQICNDGSNVYVVWEDYRDSQGTPSSDIYFTASTDNGESWLDSAVRLDGGASGSAASFSPRIVCDGANVGVVWQDYRNDSGGGLLNSDIYFNYTSPTGPR